MTALGAMLAQLIWTGGFGWFVQQHMRWPLAVAAVVLLGLGLNDLVFSERRTTDGDEVDDQVDGEHHGHAAAPAVGWLLLLPIAVLVGVAPTALGSVAAQRADTYEPAERGAVFEPLPTDGQPIPMRVFDFLDRAIWDPDMSLEGRQIVVEAFVVNDDDYPDGVLLTRFMVSCCAADGLPLQIAVPTTTQFEDDTWLRATIEWLPPDQGDPESEFVEATLLDYTELTEPPESPYESPY
jgi:uncharacterized repeat protein (TIGR03943 family)